MTYIVVFTPTCLRTQTQLWVNSSLPLPSSHSPGQAAAATVYGVSCQPSGSSPKGRKREMCTSHSYRHPTSMWEIVPCATTPEVSLVQVTKPPPPLLASSSYVPPKPCFTSMVQETITSSVLSTIFKKKIPIILTKVRWHAPTLTLIEQNFLPLFSPRQPLVGRETTLTTTRQNCPCVSKARRSPWTGEGRVVLLVLLCQLLVAQPSSTY